MMNTESDRRIFDAAFCVCDSKNYTKEVMSFNGKWPNRFKYIMIHTSESYNMLCNSLKE